MEAIWCLVVTHLREKVHAKTWSPQDRKASKHKTSILEALQL